MSHSSMTHLLYMFNNTDSYLLWGNSHKKGTHRFHKISHFFNIYIYIYYKISALTWQWHKSLATHQLLLTQIDWFYSICIRLNRVLKRYKAGAFQVIEIFLLLQWTMKVLRYFSMLSTVSIGGFWRYNTSDESTAADMALERFALSHPIFYFFFYYCLSTWIAHLKMHWPYIRTGRSHSVAKVKQKC